MAGLANPASGAPAPTTPIISTVAYVLGTAQTAGRAIFLSVTVAGTITFTFPDGSTLSGTFPTGVYEFPWSVTTVALGTATATANNLL